MLAAFLPVSEDHIYESCWFAWYLRKYQIALRLESLLNLKNKVVRSCTKVPLQDSVQNVDSEGKYFPFISKYSVSMSLKNTASF